MRFYHIVPVPKPRMTQLDKYKKRPCVERYWQFKAECKAAGLEIPEGGSHIVFYLQMPKSWPKKKLNDMNGKPHQSRPDVDNLLKAVMDAVYGEDSCVYDVRVSKFWSWQPGFSVD